MTVFSGVHDGTFEVLDTGERRNAAGVLAADGDGRLLAGSAETQDRLGDDGDCPAARGSGDSRNGFPSKTVTTEVGLVGG